MALEGTSQQSSVERNVNTTRAVSIKINWFIVIIYSSPYTSMLESLNQSLVLIPL